MQVAGNGDKAIHIYNVHTKSYAKDCVIPKTFGYMSHVKLYGNHLIFVLDHQKVLVFL